MLVPLRDNEFKMVGVLRGLTLVDDTFSQVKEARKVKFNLKRTLDYDEGEAEPPAMRARIDDENPEANDENDETAEGEEENTEDDKVETGSEDVTRERGGSAMVTD
jgi:hypothetical protein